MPDSAKEITIGRMCDGFRLKTDEYEVLIDQEDDQPAMLEEFFEYLGYKVTIEEDY